MSGLRGIAWASLLLLCACVQGLDENEIADLLILQNINTTVADTGASGTTTIGPAVADNSNGTITVVAQNLLWAKCSQVDTSGANMYNAGANDCSGAAAGTMRFCTPADDSCNGGASPGTLDGGGVSDAYNTCANLNLGGRTDWRVPTSNELGFFIFQVFRFNASLFDAIPTQPEYWSSNSLGAGNGHAINANLSSAAVRTKTNTNSVRCVTSP